MNYKDELIKALNQFGAEPDTVCIGYNTGAGSKGGGMFAGIPTDRLIETPLAENLMAGMAVGLSLRGKIPLVYFERADFLTNAFDAIVNHLDKIGSLSDGLHQPACLLRIVVGNKRNPLYTGITHTQDFSDALREMVAFPVVQLHEAAAIAKAYHDALCRARKGISTALVEYKDLY